MGGDPKSRMPPFPLHFPTPSAAAHHRQGSPPAAPTRAGAAADAAAAWPPARGSGRLRPPPRPRVAALMGVLAAAAALAAAATVLHRRGWVRAAARAASGGGLPALWLRTGGGGGGSSGGGGGGGGRRLDNWAPVATPARALLTPPLPPPSNRVAEAAGAPRGCPQRPGRDLRTHPITLVGPIEAPTSDHPDGRIVGRWDRSTRRWEPCSVPCVIGGSRQSKTADLRLFMSGHLTRRRRRRRQRQQRQQRARMVADAAAALGGGLVERPNAAAVAAVSARATDGVVAAAAAAAAAAAKRGARDHDPALVDHCPLQKHGLLTMESEAYYASVKLTRKTLEGFDIVTTTRLGSDVPILYPAWGTYDFFAPRSTAPGVVVNGSRVMAAAAITNCGAKNGRMGVITELLAAGVSVHNYGRCLQLLTAEGTGGPLPPAAAAALTTGLLPLKATAPDGSKVGWVGQKMGVLPHYKFVLAFENSNVDDYVTEKIYHAWAAGSLPVYLGARNVRAFAPGGAGSYLDVADFADVAALAAELRRLDADEGAYAAYFAWKERPVVPAFARLLARTSDVHVACRLCHKAKELLDAELGG